MTEPVSSSLLTCRDLIQSIVAAVDARDVYTATIPTGWPLWRWCWPGSCT